MKSLKVAMIGHGFMGAAHSQGWRTAHRVFQMPASPQMAVVVGRDGAKTAAAAAPTQTARAAKKSSSFVAKWLNTVWTATSAAFATSEMVTASKPRAANSGWAAARICSRVWAFFRARRSLRSPTVAG